MTPTYVTLLHADDEPLLRGIGRRELDRYLAGAPQAQQGVPDAKYRKYARKSNSSDAALLDNGSSKKWV